MGFSQSRRRIAASSRHYLFPYLAYSNQVAVRFRVSAATSGVRKFSFFNMVRARMREHT